MSKEYDLIIIGAGPGGYEAALEAADKGMKVALIEKDKLGGTCLNHGCIPTKTLMHAADAYRALANAADLGVEVDECKINDARVLERKNEVLDRLRSGIAMLMKKGKVDIYETTGVITAPNTVMAGDEELKGTNIMIATGSVTFVPPIPGTELEGVVTSDELLERDKMFDHLVIIGGGVIGMEFASLYSAFGKKVTIVEALDRVLAPLDKEISQNVKMIMKKRGVDIYAKSMVEKIEQGEDGNLVTYFKEKDEVKTVESDGVLVCVGRRSNIGNVLGEGIELETDRGRIVVNEKYETSMPGVYAIGDVIGGVMLAHTATAEGRSAVAIMNGEEPTINMDVVPSCVYTDPEIATVGITADEAKTAGIDVVTKKYIMSANGKTVIADADRGFIKVVADAETEKILGAQMMCERATDMIGEFAIAISNGLTLSDIGNTIHPHPTFVEAIGECTR